MDALNCTITVEGNKAIIVIEDLTKDFGVSSSGKTHTVAKAQERMGQYDEKFQGITIQVNAYKKSNGGTE